MEDKVRGQIAAAGSAEGEELLNLGEAAQLLGISQRTVLRLLERGEVKATKVGRQWRFRRSELAAYVDREPAAIAAPPEEDVSRALQRLSGWVEEGTLTFTTFSGETGQPDGLVPEPLARIARRILQQAMRDGVSDIHVEPGGEETRARFRIDGVLHEKLRLPARLHPALIARFKQLAEMNVGERRLPQQATFFGGFEGKEYELRASCVPTLRGEKFVMRILDRATVLIGLDRLGLLPEMRTRLERLIARPRGVFFVTGPAGAGRTTTLYSLLKHLDSNQNNVVTAEDPVEYELRGVNQMPVNGQVGLTFALAVRALLRQDPDVIMVAEIRDMETLHAMFEASGLVFAPMHVEDTPSGVSRLLDLQMGPFPLASALLGVLAQRLARRLCPACRAPGELPQALLEEARHLAVDGGLNLPADAVYYRAVGCEQCHQTGYHGRIGLFELLETGPAIKDAIIRRASTEEIRAVAVQHGMRPLAVDGILKALEGLTTVEEVLRVL